jgi:hypothetical protein
MLYSPPITDMGAGESIPAMVTGLETTTDPGCTPFITGRVKGSGVVSGGAVVLVNVSVTPPIASVVSTTALCWLEATWRTHIVCPFVIDPLLVLKPCGSHPTL